MERIIAIRKCEIREYALGVGDSLGPSEIWENHKATGKFLAGVCAFDARENMREALQYAAKWPVVCFTRPRIVFLAGDVAEIQSEARFVEDGEIVVKNATVCAIYEFFSCGWHHVAGEKVL
jgi:hypothetical protein